MKCNITDLLIKWLTSDSLLGHMTLIESPTLYFHPELYIGWY